MNETLQERRSGTDRRATETPPQDDRRIRADRRQFPVIAEGDAGDEEIRVQRAVDRYKKKRSIQRISVHDLLKVLDDLGYAEP